MYLIKESINVSTQPAITRAILRVSTPYLPTIN